jgi:hypothetical protein
MIYKKMSGTEANQLIDWAEKHNVDWDIWNAGQTLSNHNIQWEVGLNRWPEETITKPSQNHHKTITKSLT